MILLGAALVTVLWASGVADSSSAAKVVATRYERARLANDYGSWWDAVSSSCKVAPDFRNRAGWIRTATRNARLEGATTVAPSDTQVKVVSVKGSGPKRQLDVRVTNVYQIRDWEIDTIRGPDGQWKVDGFGTLGNGQHCLVW
jgi:hypothetical protein